MKFSQLPKSLKEGLSPVYLIEGDDAFFRDRAVESLRAACALSQPALNELRADGEALKGDKLLSFRDDLYTLPFFDGKRFVRVYEFYPGEKEWEAFSKYCEKPCETTVLAIVNRGKKGVDLKRKKGIVYVDCSREEEEPLCRWLFGLARHTGLEIDGDAAPLLVRYCVRDCARMKKEMEKFRLILGEGGRITKKDVEENVAEDAEYKIYELTQAASRKNFAKFSEILSDLTEKGYDEIAALSSLTSHFRTLSEVSSSSLPDAELAASLGIKPYAVQKNRETAARFGRERVKEYYLRLYELTCGSKRGAYQKTAALYAAIAKIFFG